MATTSKQSRVVGYNLQSAVETKHHLIVAHKVTNHGYDRDALSMMAHMARDEMASESPTKAITKARKSSPASGTASLSPLRSRIHPTPQQWDASTKPTLSTTPIEMRISVPPENGSPIGSQTRKNDKAIRVYFTNVCEACALKSKCTMSKERRVRRWEHEAILERVQKRLDENPEKVPLRSRTVEHPFGTIKAWMGATHFKMKTLPHVATKMALHVLAYNMMRVMKILGVPRLVEVMRA
jgi:Transposase DDE domain